MTKPKKPNPPDDAAQSERFISTAKERQADESGVSFEHVMKSVVPAKSVIKPGVKRKSDG